MISKLKNVMVDSVKYSIAEVDEPILLNAVLCNGDVDYNLAHIRIARECGDSRELQVLMHEIMHALLYERGLEKHKDDETLVDELSKGIINLIRENKDLINTIQQKD